MKKFDPQSLSEFNGKESGKPVYIARDGKVYDVSGSKLWKTGRHMKRHAAGEDLSVDFSAAPHGDEVFERVTQVGTMEERDSGNTRRLPVWLAGALKHFPILARHPHPMLVHYPIVFMFSTTGFILLALVTGNRAFEITALHCLGAGLLFTPLAIATGLFTWWLNYDARPMRQVRIKTWVSVFLMLDAIVLFIWRLVNPEIITTLQSASYFYLFLVCVLVPLVSIIGWFGAQLTFPLEKN